MSKEKRKHVLTRKQRAVRRVVILLVMVLILSGTGIIRFLPIQGLRLLEERQGTGRTKVLTSIWNPTKEEWTNVVYLSANENAVILAGSTITPVGWFGDTYSIIDCSAEETPVHSCVHLEGSSNSVEGYATDVPIRSFGRVDDPRVEVIEVCLMAGTHSDEGVVYQEMLVQRSEQSEWMELEGRSYFLMETERLEWDAGTFFKPILRALDADGNVVTEYEVHTWSWSSYRERETE